MMLALKKVYFLFDHWCAIGLKCSLASEFLTQSPLNVFWIVHIVIKYGGQSIDSFMTISISSLCEDSSLVKNFYRTIIFLYCYLQCILCLRYIYLFTFSDDCCFVFQHYIHGSSQGQFIIETYIVMLLSILSFSSPNLFIREMY